MRFVSPEWLAVLPALLLAARQWPKLGLFRPLRLFLVALITFTLMRPEWRVTSSGLDLWVLWDASASAADTLGPRRDEFFKLLEAGRGPDDRLHRVDFAEESSPVDAARGIAYGAGLEGTRTARALRDTLARMSDDRNHRVLVVTDGLATEPVAPMREPLVAARVRLDHRIFSADRDRDAAVLSLRAPSRVRVGEPFVVQAVVTGPDGPTPYVLTRDGKAIAHGTMTVKGGRGMIALSDRPALSGANRYEFRVERPGDPVRGNDARGAWVEAAGEQRVLLITGYDNDPIAGVLAGRGFRVETVRDFSTLHPGRLVGARAVILNNVPLAAMPQRMPDALAFYVREQGGGLMMVGGRHAFASGGWAKSPVEEVLPVSMELKDDVRRGTVNLAIALDRSGSMGASVGTKTKMDLADAGAVAAVELLSDRDRVAVLAVDSSSHVIVPMSEVGPNRAAIIRNTLRIETAGGGIFVNTALRDAWDQLKKVSDGGAKHIILFADASDAEDDDNPGSWRALVTEVVKAGGTVSTIGLGSDTDSDAQFLRDIAALGNGRALFNTDPNKLPEMFSGEVVTVARSAFIDEPTGVAPAAGWRELAAAPPPGLSSVDGYNLSYLRPGAVEDFVTTDEYAAPLVAHRRVGSGRTVAVTFPLGGDFSASVRAWPGYGDCVQTLTRWLENPVALDGLAVRAEVDGESLVVELRHADKPGVSDWTGVFATHPPALRLAGRDGGATETAVWEKISPGLYRARFDLTQGEPVRGAVAVTLPGKPGEPAVEAAIPFGPLSAERGIEHVFEPARPEELRALSAATGGRELLNLSRAFEGGGEPVYRDFTLPLVVTTLVFLLIEALLTRLGAELAPGRFRRFLRRRSPGA